MPDPRPTPPERVPVADLVAQARDALARDFGDSAIEADVFADLLTALVGALESERETVSDLRVLVGAHLREKKATRAALEDTAAERDRAHATLREIAALDPDACDASCGCSARRLARERLASRADPEAIWPIDEVVL